MGETHRGPTAGGQCFDSTTQRFVPTTVLTSKADSTKLFQQGVPFGKRAVLGFHTPEAASKYLSSLPAENRE